MKRFSARGSFWRGVPSIEDLFGITEAGKGLIALIMVVELAYVLWVRRLGLELPGGAPQAAAGSSNTAEIGAVLYTQYAYPFQLAAVVLLIAIVAAITLTMRRRPGLRLQDIAGQVAVKAADRVRLVSMPSEREP